ncbi:AAR_G0030850.mRNA.1.CDS.1 [Saccharomyces cerevisiae]|nr:Ime1p [Saccharomyces cerevisiae YJM271]CAI4568477.1 AAR_G0030850.mRNA.1.CDS.1 [Saccharomyces cerevisiae]CAI4950044.1 CRE_HP_G0036310.mRNA.1.CDS.1 [Saccharomyces cerevisiae]CAI4974440.1 BBT_HP_G0061270.mRNA.1.CDS.1 [Saccharomyces cerevisiae]CAI5069554.1 CRE_HP_G0116870.mRNA.1.CDS.1 [Saccharomyces cerevisiae]
MQADMHGILHAALEDGFFLFPFEQQQQPNIYYDTTTDQEDRPCFSFGSTISPRSWHFEKSDKIASSQLQNLVHTQPIHLINPQILFNEEFLNLENIDSQPISKETKTTKDCTMATGPERGKKSSESTRSSSLSSLFSNDESASTFHSSFNNHDNFQKSNRNGDDIDISDTIKYETNTNAQKDIKIFQENFEFNEFPYTQDFYPYTTNYTYSKPTNIHESINSKNTDSYSQYQDQFPPHTDNIHSFNNRHYSNHKSTNCNYYNNTSNNNNASDNVYEADPFIDEPQVPSYYYPLEIAFDVEKSPPPSLQKLNSKELEFLKKLNSKLSRYAAAYSFSSSNDQDYYDKVRFQEISYKFSKTYS